MSDKPPFHLEVDVKETRSFLVDGSRFAYANRDGDHSYIAMHKPDEWSVREITPYEARRLAIALNHAADVVERWQEEATQ